jgi:hypothetical protein
VHEQNQGSYVLLISDLVFPLRVEQYLLDVIKKHFSKTITGKDGATIRVDPIIEVIYDLTWHPKEHKETISTHRTKFNRSADFILAILTQIPARLKKKDNTVNDLFSIPRRRNVPRFMLFWNVTDPEETSCIWDPAILTYAEYQAVFLEDNVCRYVISDQKGLTLSESDSADFLFGLIKSRLKVFLNVRLKDPYIESYIQCDDRDALPY